MKKGQDITKRTQWLKKANEIVGKAIERRDGIEDLNWSNRGTPEDRLEEQRKTTALTRDIRKLTKELDKIEVDSGLGAIVLFGEGFSDLERIVTALLVVSRLLPNVGSTNRTVAQIADTVSAGNVEDALLVRLMFRDDGLLNLSAWINISHAPTLDESGVRLRELALNRALGFQPDTSELKTDAMAMTTQGYRR